MSDTSLAATAPAVEPAACMAALICENAVLARHLAAAQARCQDLKPTKADSPEPTRRRRKLYELPSQAQDLLLAMSFQPASLRAEIERALGRLHGRPVQLGGSEADVLYSSLHDLGTRNALSDALHKRLDARHAVAVRRLAGMREAAALRQTWLQALHGKASEGAQAETVPATLWALLTHPLGPTQQVRALAEARTWLFVQARRALAGSAHEAAKHCQTQALRDEVSALRLRLQQQQAAHLEALQLSRQDAAQALGEARRNTAQPKSIAARGQRTAAAPHVPRVSKAKLLPAVATAAGSPAEPKDKAAQNRARAAVQGQRILCVGGIQHAVARYRQRIERMGGRFEHHDGGIEDNPQALTGRLERADLVICQAGCINHAAYHCVKQHCQRTGKPCLYLKRPSLSRFDRALQGLQTPLQAAPETTRPAAAGPA